MKYLLLLLLTYTALPLSAQHWCASISPAAAQKEIPPVARPKVEVTIRVVVHAVWQAEEQEISEAQIAAQLTALNEDFRALNADQSEVFFAYQNVITDTEINFELATTNPAGNPHPGIVYRSTEVDGIGSSFEGDRRRLCYDELGGSTAWPTDCYLNIWVADFGGSGIAGQGIFPAQVGDDVPAEEDGVYLQWDRFGTLGLAPPYNLGRTLTHEIGHYLNVLHPWGNGNTINCNPATCCDDPAFDDFVDDTQKQFRTFLEECPSGATFDCDNTVPNYQNFMGFADDACLLMFTEGQKNRMWATLMGARNGLVTCSTSTTEPSIAPAPWLSYAYWQDNQLLLASTQANVSWSLYNVQGQLVRHLGRLGLGEQSLIFPSLPAGLYLLRGQEGPTSRIRKVIKMR